MDLPKIRNCQPNDVPNIRQLVAQMQPLDLHSAFTYWVLFTYSSELCHLALDGQSGLPCGFVSGVISSSDKTVAYLWQLGVHPDYRKRPVSAMLTRRFIGCALALGIKRLQFSIDPHNFNSKNLAFRMAARMQTSINSIGRVQFFDILDSKSTDEVIYEMPLPLAPQ